MAAGEPLNRSFVSRNDIVSQMREALPQQGNSAIYAGIRKLYLVALVPRSWARGTDGGSRDARRDIDIFELPVPTLK